MLDSFWRPFSCQIANVSENLHPKMIGKKGTPLDANEGLWPFPQAPWQPPSRTRFSKQETTIWARNNNSCSLLSPFLSPFPGIGYFWISFQFFATISKPAHFFQRTFRTVLQLLLEQLFLVWEMRTRGGCSRGLRIGGRLVFWLWRITFFWTSFWNPLFHSK